MAKLVSPGTQGAIPSKQVDTNIEKPSRPPNPIWRMMGLPNMRLRLPSRNWTIFLLVTGSFSAAVIYDKREKKRVQRKWCKLVEHLAKEPLDPKTMPRRLTIFLEGPPGDGLRIAQDHFKDYVKPILVSSGLDWEFIQGRKEGDVRAELAERIRASRAGEHEALSEQSPIARVRKGNNIVEFEGPRGDIVLGRHTWKEYVRGLHEGWLGPITEPTPFAQDQLVSAEIAEESRVSGPIPEQEKFETLPGITIHSTPVDQQIPTEDSSTISENNVETTKKHPQPFISTADYQLAALPAQIPETLDPSIPISFPHILGFFNTPLRLYRFLNRRTLADTIGRDTAAIILASTRPYNTTSIHPESSLSANDDGRASDVSDKAEQATVLETEERDWHKSVKNRIEGEGERPWLDDIVLDARIAHRMQKAVLTLDDEVKARNIVVPEEEIEGWIKGTIRRMYRECKNYVTTPQASKGPEYGNLEED